MWLSKAFHSLDCFKVNCHIWHIIFLFNPSKNVPWFQFRSSSSSSSLTAFYFTVFTIYGCGNQPIISKVMRWTFDSSELLISVMQIIDLCQKTETRIVVILQITFTFNPIPHFNWTIHRQAVSWLDETCFLVFCDERIKVLELIASWYLFTGHLKWGRPSIGWKTQTRLTFVMGKCRQGGKGSQSKE